MPKLATFNIFQAESHQCCTRIVNTKWYYENVLDLFSNAGPHR